MQANVFTGPSARPGATPDAAPLPGTTAELGGELVRLVKLLVSMKQQMPAADSGVDNTHYPVLFTLARDPQRISDLAGCVHADVSTVSRQVSHLVHHGLVTKVADPGDGRAHRVSLTDAGRAAIDRITELRGEWLARVMADWTERQARDFLDHLTHFAHSLEAARTAERARR